MSYSHTRQPYEFESKTKYEAIRNAEVCEICGLPETPDDPFECNHVVAIWFAREVPCLSIEVIKSLANIQIVHRSCHKDLHDHESRQFYQELVPFVVARYLTLVVDHSKDDWRKSKLPNQLRS